MHSFFLSFFQRKPIAQSVTGSFSRGLTGRFRKEMSTKEQVRPHLPERNEEAEVVALHAPTRIQHSASEGGNGTAGQTEKNKTNKREGSKTHESARDVAPLAGGLAYSSVFRRTFHARLISLIVN